MTRKSRESDARVVQTKIRPPTPGVDLIARPHVVAALRDAVASRSLTLVSAPAGYGKTTLLSMLPGACPDLGAAWLSLDEEDNDPASFLSAIVASLQRLNPDCGTSAVSLVASLPNPRREMRRIVGALVNDVLETIPGRFVLVLDDLHLVAEPAAYVALEYLLERLPPQMRLVVAARHDPPLPLARLRARGQLAELRLTDLRFTDEEASAFLNGRLRLGLSGENLDTLMTRTEGWPAGLRLLAGSLDRVATTDGRGALIGHLAQTGRFVFDFLADEVLARQEADVRSFLLETALLAELTPPLCQAVTGRGDATTMLETLYRRGLFVVALDETGTTLRYHALFAEFLRHRLACEMPERVIDLHRRAAQAQTAPSRTIGHYVAAQMWEQAAEAIERAGGELLRQGLLDTLSGWIGALPCPAREARPRLSYYLGICAWRKGEHKAARILLERALRQYEAAGDEYGQGETLAYLAAGAILQDDFEGSGAMIRRALALPIAPHSRVQLLLGRARLAFLRQEWKPALADLQTAFAVNRDSLDHDVLRTLLAYLHPAFYVDPTVLRLVESACFRSLPDVTGQISPVRAAVEGHLAFVHLWRGRTEQAIQVGQSALEVSGRVGGAHPFLNAIIAVSLAIAHTVRGEYSIAERLYDELIQEIRQAIRDEAIIPGYLYLRGRLAWLQGRYYEARQAYNRMDTGLSVCDLPGFPVVRAALRALLEIADRRYDAAERTLREVADLERAVRVSTFYCSVRLTLAHLYYVWNRPEQALAALSPILLQCQREGTPGLIIREGVPIAPALRLAVERGAHAAYAGDLLALLDGANGHGLVCIPETGETLTAREIETLRLVAAGQSNRAIAATLVISEETVKTHVAHILRKLDVSSRTQAAARFRDMGLAGPGHRR